MISCYLFCVNHHVNIISAKIYFCTKKNFRECIGQLVLPERRELVLDYIVERKRMDDLCSSIKDGRFKEQKVSWQSWVYGAEGGIPKGTHPGDLVQQGGKEGVV